MRDITQNEKVQNIATYAHLGQFRRDGVTAYISHVMNVVARLKAKGESDEVIQAAWLHDVLEDTKITVKDLVSEGINARVIEAVVALTKNESVPYTYYLINVKSNEIARKVKIADMLSNLSDDPTEKQIIKYARGLLFLI